MKVLNSNYITAFGGLNFVLNTFDQKDIGNLLNKELPSLGAQSSYDWRDILYSYWSVFFCGGDCAEDLSGNFKPNLSQSPFLKVPSPDRVLNRLKELANPSDFFSTQRGKYLHHFAINEKLANLNLLILKRLFNLTRDKVDLDYDNTVCFTKKQDAERTYKKELGYIPAVGLIGSKIVYVENRNGRSNASVLQDETLKRMFEKLEQHGIKVNRFRADSASYTYKIIKVLDKNVDKFYVKARMSSGLASIIASVKHWQVVGNPENGIYRGEIIFTPFERAAMDLKEKHQLKPYRFIVTKEKRKDAQINAFTQEACNYSVIITNDKNSKADNIVYYYNKRGGIEREFDVLKNDFGWRKLPFSLLEQNLVYMQITAICRNLYHYIIGLYSKKFKGLSPTYRIKKFIFRFITIPAKWIYRSRQWHLKIYGKIDFRT